MTVRVLPSDVLEGPSFVRSVLRGIVAGIAGGVGFGLLMVVFRPTMLMGIGGMIGAEGFLGGWAFHLFISSTIGSIFGLVLGRMASSYRFGFLWGLAYGLIWWIFGGQILSPLMRGAMDQVLSISPNSWVGFVGHLIYGSLTGVGTVLLRKRFGL